MSVPVDVILDPEADAIAVEAELARVADEKRRIETENEQLITRWVNRITHARAHDDLARKQYAQDRKIARGDTTWLVDTNLVGAILEILMAFIYAKDPDVSIRPSQAVGTSRLPQMTMLAKTMEIVISRLLKEARLKVQAKRWVRSAMTVGVGWIKAAMQTRLGPDPIVQQQINSLQENLKRLDQMQSDLAAGDVRDEDAEKASIRNAIQQLKSNAEREFAEGAIIDFCAAEDVLVSPECGELENYLAAPWIAFDIYKSKDDARLLCDWPDDQDYRDAIKSATLYNQRPRKGDDKGPDGQWTPVANTADESETDTGFLKIIEIWSLRDGLVFTMIEGVKRWARQPYAPRTGSRFYPCFQLAFHYNDADRHPQSDVRQLAKLQEEFGRTRSNFAEHRRRAIPATLFDESQIDKATMEKIRDSESNEFIGVSTTNNSPMQNAFFPKPYPAVDVGLYSTDAIRVDMEKMSGAQDAQQGSVAVEKTLGEAEIQQSGFMARTGARRDFMEDKLSEMCEYLTQLALQVMDAADAQKYAGPDALWVKLSVEEALTLFNIEVKAGSTGKPKNQMDRQTWGTILPMLEKMIDRIGAARIKGEEWAATPFIALLKETAQRLDDRIDIEAMLPVPPPPQPEPPPMPDPVALSKIEEAKAHAYLYRAQGVAALASAGKGPEAALEGAEPSGPAMEPAAEPAAGGGDPQVEALLPLLAQLGTAPQPELPAPVLPPPINVVVNMPRGASSKTVTRNPDGSYLMQEVDDASGNE